MVDASFLSRTFARHEARSPSRNGNVVLRHSYCLVHRSTPLAKQHEEIWRAIVFCVIRTIESWSAADKGDGSGYVQGLLSTQSLFYRLFECLNPCKFLLSNTLATFVACAGLSTARSLRLAYNPGTLHLHMYRSTVPIAVAT